MHPGSPRRMRGPVAHSASRERPLRATGSRTDQAPGVTLTTFLDRTPDLDHDTRTGGAPALDPGSVPALDELAPTPADVAAVVEHDPTLTPDIVVAARPAADEDDE